jgi:hypothetical protein
MSRPSGSCWPLPGAGRQAAGADHRRGRPRPGSEHEKIIRTTLAYLTAKQPYLDYPRALAAGWAHRHRRHRRRLPPPDGRTHGSTGARWGLPGGQAILWLRTIHAHGDLDIY